MIDYLRLAWGALTHQRIRSYLTVLGIVIGVAAVVALVSISKGMDAAIKSVFEKFGADKIVVIPGGEGGSLVGALTGRPFTDDDVRAVESVPDVKEAVGAALGLATVEYRGEKKTAYVSNIDADKARHILEDVFGFSLESGVYLKRGDRYRAIVGWRVAHTFFGSDIHPGAVIYINGRRFRVLGVLEQIGSRQDDSTIFIPSSVYEEVTGKKLEYMMIVAKAKAGVDLEEAAERIKRKLKRERGAEDFSVMTTKQLMERISTVLGIVSLVLVSIAAISLVVGGVGVMNTMYMSVMERVREIGVMKAVGATPRQILTIFLIESALLGVFGGVFGVIMGVLAAKGIEAVALSTGLTMFRAYLGADLIGGAVLFAALVGMLSGALPARYAASLNPVDALRYE